LKGELDQHTFEVNFTHPVESNFPGTGRIHLKDAVFLKGQLAVGESFQSFEEGEKVLLALVLNLINLLPVLAQRHREERIREEEILQELASITAEPRGLEP